MSEPESTRVYRWVWAVRLAKPRVGATVACRAGHVRVNSKPIKPASLVRLGDEVRVMIGSRERIVEVTKIIEKRVGASVAAECLIDRSPTPPTREFVAPVAVRDRGTGRPTKRERRQLDRLRGRR